ncbi:class I SAM-dependent methyltransferase [Cyclobacteriaceae bacterium]|nr:class I SAM-dependent methyltransferase [Cyclobacteriaceae bacterium]
MGTDFLSIDLKDMRKATFIKENLAISTLHNSKVLSGKGFINRKKCPICKSEDTQFLLTKESINHVICKNCDCCFPEKIPADVNDVYSDASYVSEFSDLDVEREGYKKERFGKERLNLIEDSIGSLEGKSILDIGCGRGWFLDLCKDKGMACYGQELGLELARDTSKRLGIEIIDLPVTEIKDKDDSFDVIVMFDLIEHVLDPVKFVQSLRPMLKNNGIMLFLTPNYNSFSVRRLMKDSSLIMPTDHVCLFSKKATEVFAEMVDLKLDYIAFAGIDMGDYLAYLEHLGHNIDSNLKQILYDDIQPLIDKSAFSNHMRFILKKSDL